MSFREFFHGAGGNNPSLLDDRNLVAQLLSHIQNMR